MHRHGTAGHRGPSPADIARAHRFQEDRRRDEARRRERWLAEQARKMRADAAKLRRAIDELVGRPKEESLKAGTQQLGQDRYLETLITHAEGQTETLRALQARVEAAQSRVVAYVGVATSPTKAAFDDAASALATAGQVLAAGIGRRKTLWRRLKAALGGRVPELPCEREERVQSQKAAARRRALELREEEEGRRRYAAEQAKRREEEERLLAARQREQEEFMKQAAVIARRADKLGVLKSW